MVPKSEYGSSRLLREETPSVVATTVQLLHITHGVLIRRTHRQSIVFQLHSSSLDLHTGYQMFPPFLLGCTRRKSAERNARCNI